MTFEQTFQGRPNTIITYESLFRQHIKFVTLNLENFNDDSLRTILKNWQEKGLSKNTKVILIRLLERYLKFLNGPKIDSQKIIKIFEKSEQQKEAVVLSATEAQLLLRSTKERRPKLYPVILLALHAGLRRGEIFGLRCGDVDMLHGKVKISHSYDGPTKNGKGRVVPLSRELSRTLAGTKNLLMRHPNETVFKKFDPNPALKNVCRRLGLKKIRFHDLRHTFASLALNNGISPKQVAAWLGHSSVSTTLDIYWNLTDEKCDLSFLPE